MKDPEGVAQFEEYSEYVGICRGCFEPGSSPRDAPRRHRNFNRKRSDERIGRTSRVEKNRRESSGDEKLDRNSPSWLAGGIAGYGLGKMGEGLFKRAKDFDDTYSVKSGRYSPESSRKHRERRGSEDENRRLRKSEDTLETGVTADGRFDVNNSDPYRTAASKRSKRAQGRSRSRDRESNLSGAVVGTAIGTSVGDLSSHRRRHSRDRTSIKSKPKTRNGSESDSKRTSHRKKEKRAEKRGFFSFGSNSSSSSLDTAHSRSGKTSKGKSDDKKAEAALLGLGAAAAALAAADSHSGRRKNGIKELVGRKETRDERFQHPTAEDAGWEDEENYISEAGSIDSGLAFGGDSDRSSGPKRDRQKRSEMSGKGSLPGRRSSWDDGRPANHASMMSPRHSPPLQFVDPVPIPDFRHLDERMEASEPFSSRPPVVSHPSEDTAFHQPQPQSRVSSSIYTAQVPYSTHSLPSYRPDETSQVRTGAKEVKLSRSATLPASFEAGDAPNELTRRRKPSVKDDSSIISGVRFALPEDDKDERREKRRRKKESEKDDRLDRGSRAEDDEAGRERDSTSRKRSDARKVPTDGPDNSSSNSWVAPAAVGAAALAGGQTDSKVEETKDERRERRRRERRRDDEEEDSRRERRRREKGTDAEDSLSKSERSKDDDREETREERKARRRAEREERERKEVEEEASASSKPRVSFGKLPSRADGVGEEENQTEKEEASSKQEAYKHEEYSSFFTPDINDTSDQQAKISGANADADISFDQSANFVIAEPREIRDQSGTPEFSPADTLDRVDQSRLKFPWQIPRLRLLYPTPPPSRGSTPIIEPKELPEQETGNFSEITPDDHTSSGVGQQHDTPGDHEISQEKSTKINDRYTDPPSDEDGERWRRRKPKKIPLSIDQEDSPADAGSYGNDNGFAAVLAASAEDAGFDPSIVIDNPAYRRRDSPPGSNERDLPSSLDDKDNESSTRNGKKKGKTTNKQSQPVERDDAAIVNKIIDQVDEKDSGETNRDSKANDDNTSPAKPRKSKKSKKGSRRSLVNDEDPEDQDKQAAEENDASKEAREAETRSVTESSMPTHDDGYHEKPQTLNGEGESAGSVAASVAVASAIAAGTSTKANGPKKGSIWDRVLGKTTNTSPGPKEEVDVKREEPVELSRKDSKKSKKSKRKSAQSDLSFDGGGGDDADGSQNGESQGNRSVNSLPESVAQYLTKESDPEQSQEPVTESFLGERPDPPPPPDIGAKIEEPHSVVKTAISKELETDSPSETHSRWPSEISTSDGPMSPKTVSSPTAVPIHFKRPAWPRVRSSSQSPLSTTRIADDEPQPHPSRPRPRSTQFENSKEYRPLWLVERNQSRQEVPRDETYPPLPSSHSTSRNSSLDSLNRQHEHGNPELTLESSRENGSLEDRDSRALESDLLDSQQPTPTASSFQHPSVTQSQPPMPSSRSGSPSKDQRAHIKHESSKLELATLATVVGGTAAIAFHESGADRELAAQEHPYQEAADSRRNIEDSASKTQKIESSSLNEGEDSALKKKKKKKSKKEKPSMDPLPKQRDVEPSNVSETSDQKAGSSSTPPTQTVVNQSTIETISSGGERSVAAIAVPDSELTADLAPKSLSTWSIKTNKLSHGNVENDVYPFNISIPPGTEERKKVSSEVPADDVGLPQKAPDSHRREHEFSPLSTPLPEGDDSDLFDESLRAGDKEKKSSRGTDISGDPSKVSRASEEVVSSKSELVQRINPLGEGTEPAEEDSKNNGAAEEDFFGFSTKKKGKKGKKNRQSLPNESISESPMKEMGLREISSPSATPDAILAKPDESRGPAPYDSFADGQDIEIRDETLDTENVQQNIDDSKSSSNKKKSKKDKKKKKFLSLDEQGSSEPKPVSLEMPDDEDRDPLDIVAVETKENQPDHETRQILSGEEPAHGVQAVPLVIQKELYESSSGFGDSKDMPANTEHGDKIPKATDLVSHDIDQNMKGARHEPLDLNRNEAKTLDPAADTSVPADGKNSERSHAGLEGPTISVQNSPAAEPLEASSKSPKIDMAAQNTSHEVQLSTPAEEGTLGDERNMEDASLGKPALADNLNLVSKEDAKGREPKQENDPASEDPENLELAENLADLDQSGEKLTQDDEFNAFPVKKNKKGKKSRKEEPFFTEESTGAKSVENVVSASTLEHEAQEAAKDDDPSTTMTKKSKKEKKSKKKSSVFSTSSNPVEQSEDDVSPGQVVAAEEEDAANVAPLSAEENDLTLSSIKPVASNLDDAEEGYGVNMSAKKSKKGKKGKKSLANSTLDFQTAELAEELPAVEAPIPPESEDATPDLSDNTKPVGSAKAMDEEDLAEEKSKEEPNDEDFPITKAKKGKKGKKSLLTSAIGLQTAELTEKSTPESGNPTSDKSKATKPTPSIEALNERNSADENQEGVLDEEVFAVPKAKKKKKAKKPSTFSWDDDVDLAAEGEDMKTISETAQQNNVPIEAKEGVDDGSRQPSNEVTSRGRDFSWGAFKSNGPEKDSPAATKISDEGGSTNQTQQDHDYANNLPDAKNEGSSQQPRLDGKLSIDDDLEQRVPLKSKTIEEAFTEPQIETLFRDNKAPTAETTFSQPEKIDLERSDSSAHVKPDAIEAPSIEHTQSPFNAGNPSIGPIVLPVQSPSDVPTQLTFDDIVKPSMVEEPREPQVQEKPPATLSEHSPIRELDETIPDPELAPSKKGKKSKKSRKGKTVNLDIMPNEPINSGQDKGDETGSQEVEPKEYSELANEHQVFTANNMEVEGLDEPSTKESKRVQINDRPEILEGLSNQSLKGLASQNISPPETPLSVGSVDMLDPEQQREYNEEYRKQLQKELSPLQGDNGTLDTREEILDNDDDRRDQERPSEFFGDKDQSVPQSDLADNHVLNRSVTHESDQRILADKDKSIDEDSFPMIPEDRETQSKFSSLAKTSTDTDDRLERKKSKKEKKSKKLRKPVIWEDDTATPGLTNDTEQPLGDHVAHIAPVEDDEPQKEGRVVYEDLPSPTRGSPGASRSPKYDEGAEDYFAVKPRAEAEKNVDMDATFDQPSPEQRRNLPDWSFPPEELAVGRSSGDSGSQDRARQRSPLSRDGEPIPSNKPGSVGEIAVAVAAGAGIIGATAISKEESRKAKKDKKDKKGKKKTAKANLESMEDQEKQEQDDDIIDAQDRPNSFTIADQRKGQDNEAPSKSPDHSTTAHHLPKYSQQDEQSSCRDSAIQIADSPVIPLPELIHRPQHDSGYPVTEASPVIKDSNDYSQEEHEIVDPYTDPRISTTGFFHEDGEGENSRDNEVRRSIVESDDQELPGDRRRSKQRRRRRESNVTYDSDDSNDSGYDKQRRVRKFKQTEELREPSPVSSTTKRRSSALFDSSPSDRQTLEQDSGNLPGSDQTHGEQPPLGDFSAHNEAPLVADHRTFEFIDDGAYRSKERPTSIFGGPLREERSRSRSPANSDAYNRSQLERISEDSLENSPLARKGKRGVGDVGLPDSGVKARRTSRDLSPLVTGVTAGAAALGGEDLFKRLHKKSRDDDDHSLDTDRSTNRDYQDRPRRLSNQSNTSAHLRDSEWRRHGINSPDSIHAIIRTPPEQVRSSSGQSFRSSGTPPLRRVDRSLSGDLRGASREIDAKRRAKLAEAAPAVPGIAAETIASSSTYDPLTDKGKTRGDMADVYVSVPNFVQETPH